MTDTIINYLNNSSIEYQPLRLIINEKGKQTTWIHELRACPKNIDFTGGYENIQGKKTLVKRKPAEVFEQRRKKVLHKFPYIGIDTGDVYHIDVDFKDDKYDSYSQESKDWVAKMKSENAWFPSVTKKHGCHIFFKPKVNYDDLGLSGKPELIYDDIEILSGMWSYAHKTQVVHNADKPIQTLDLLPLIKEKKSKSKKPKKLKVIESEKKVIDNIQPALEMDDSWSNEKKCIFELIQLLPSEYYENYKEWTRMIWSLASYENPSVKYENENLFDIAKMFSMKSESKYDEDGLEKLWTESYNACTIGTLKYHCRQVNSDRYYQITTKYFLNGIDLRTLNTDESFADIYLQNQVVNHIVKINGDKLILYTFNGTTWDVDTKQFHHTQDKIRKELKYFFDELVMTTIQSFREKIDYHYSKGNEEEAEAVENKKDKTLCVINQAIMDVQNYRKIANVVQIVVQKLAGIKNDIEFDANGYIIGFTNKCFDLKTFEERKCVREDYVLTTTGYSWCKSSEDELKELDDLITSIFPDEKLKTYYTCIMATALYGVQIEQFIIANGSGGNGKGVINELLGETLGNFYYKANSETFTKPLKEGNNPQIANMNKKRLIIAQEVESNNKRINGTVIKEITGCKKINSRANYSNDCELTFNNTTILECNKKPLIDGRIDESYERRIRDVPFESTFTDNQDILDLDLPNVYPKNARYKDDEFQTKFKCVLFNYLINFMKDFKAEHGKLVTDGFHIPTKVKERTKEYLESSDEIKEWFNENYEIIKYDSPKTESDKIADDNYIKVKDVYNQYKYSEFYINLSKAEKRKQNYKYFREYIRDNINFKMFYKERTGSVREILFDHIAKVEEEEEPPVSECLI